MLIDGGCFLSKLIVDFPGVEDWVCYVELNRSLGEKKESLGDGLYCVVLKV